MVPECVMDDMTMLRIHLRITRIDGCFSLELALGYLPLSWEEVNKPGVFKEKLCWQNVEKFKKIQFKKYKVLVLD